MRKLWWTLHPLTSTILLITPFRRALRSRSVCGFACRSPGGGGPAGWSTSGLRQRPRRIESDLWEGPMVPLSGSKPRICDCIAGSRIVTAGPWRMSSGTPSHHVWPGWRQRPRRGRFQRHGRAHRDHLAHRRHGDGTARPACCGPRADQLGRRSSGVRCPATTSRAWWRISSRGLWEPAGRSFCSCRIRPRRYHEPD